jgi:hypothetical protein
VTSAHKVSLLSKRRHYRPVPPVVPRSLKLAVVEASAACDVTARPKETVAGRSSEYESYVFQVFPSALTRPVNSLSTRFKRSQA